MRISQQNIVQNTANVMKSNQVPQELKALLGKVIEGKIVGIQNNQTATLVSGDLQLNVSLAGVKLQENQTVAIQIMDYKDGALVAKLAGDNDASSGLAQLLSKLGVNVQEENLMILDAMKNANMPLSKDQFQLIRQSMIEVKTLMAELNGDNTLSFGDEMNTPIKQLALKIIQMNTSTATGQVQTPGGQPQGTTHAQAQSLNQAQIPGLNQALTSQVETQSQTLSQGLSQTQTPLVNQTQTQAMSQAQTQVLSQALNQGADQAQISTLQSDLNMASESVKTQFADHSNAIKNTSVLFDAIKQVFSSDDKEAAIKLLSKFDYAQSSLILKNELPVTLKNIFLAYDALSDEGGITNRFMNILKELEGMHLSKENVSALVNQLTSEAPVEEKLESFMKLIIKEASEHDVAPALEREFNVLKESQTLSKSLNEQMFAMQIPFTLNESLHKVDLFYKKSKHKPDPNDMTLLIALETHQFGEVRCVIHKLNDQYKLDFSLQNEETKKVFEQHEEALKDQLKNKKIVVHFGVKMESAHMDMNQILSIDDTYGFDLKV